MTPTRGEQAEQVAKQIVSENVRDYWDKANADFPGKAMLVQAIATALLTLRQETVEACAKVARDAIVEEYPGSDQSLERVLDGIRAALGGTNP